MDAAERAALDPDLQAKIRELCRRDILFWFNEWAWTYDPRIPALLPFVLWEEQEKAVLWIKERIERGEDGVIEKSRDQGATWLCCGVAVHKWLFEGLTKFSFMSKKEDDVDLRDNPDSIFEKIRTLIDTQPIWLTPAGYGREHDNFMRIVNPANGATMIGMTGKEAGRAGRSTAAFADEHAFIPEAERADRALSQNTPCRIYVSTANGVGNLFYRKVHGGKVPKIRLHWKTDPRKNHFEALDAEGTVVATGNGNPSADLLKIATTIRYPWYDAERERLDDDPVALAQEVDIDYTASLEGVVIEGKWIEAAVELHKRFLFPDYQFVIAAHDPADEGKSVHVYCERTGPIVRFIKGWKGADMSDPSDPAVELAIERGAKWFFFDAPGVGANVASNIRKRGRTVKFRWVGIYTSVPATNTVWPDGRTSKERFGNLRAELWWLLRRRFQKTYRFVTEGAEYPLEELISIPDHNDLRTQLSTPTWKTDTAGRVMIEKKEDMRKRNIASPDYADALVLTYAPMPKQRPATAGGKREVVAKYVPR